MRETKRNYDVKPSEKAMIDTAELQIMLCSGRATAVDVGTKANSKIIVGRRIFWNVNKVKKYLDAISE
jgi:hypothetical protein